MPTSPCSFRIGKVLGYLRGKVWYLCYHENGKRRRPRAGKDLQVAKQLAAQINAQLESDNPTLLSFEPISISQLRDRWLEHHEHVLRSSVHTISRYRTATDHLLNFLEHHPVKLASLFSSRAAEAFVRHLRTIEVAPNGHKNSTKRRLLDKGVKYILECCRALFSYAAKRRHLSAYAQNPFSIIEVDRMPVEDAKPIVLLTAEQEKQFLEECDDWQFPIFLTLMLTGLRPGELCHLLVGDVDLQAGILRVRKGRIPVLGLIAAGDFEKPAWDEAKKKGLLCINMRQMFGDEALELMGQVEKLLSGLGQNGNIQEQESRFAELTDTLKELKTNPIVTTIRSIGFEIVAALFLRSDGHERVELGRVVTWKNTSRDVDVFGLRGSGLRVIECKAYHRGKSISPDEVKKFFTETVPALKHELRDKGQIIEECVAEIWTTGSKGKEAGDALYKLKAPKTDKWRIVRIEEMKKLLSPAIRGRSLELLNAISVGSGEKDLPSFDPKLDLADLEAK